MNDLSIDLSRDNFIAESIDCIDVDLGAEQRKYLLNALPGDKSHTLVLDIDETLLSVRRWIDEIQINDRVLFTATNSALRVTKITKEVTLQFDDGTLNVYSFYFDEQQPFGQLSSPLDVGDRMDIGGRLASVREVLTSYVSVWDEAVQREVLLNCIEDEYLRKVQYLGGERADSKFRRVDLVHDNLYLVRFRSGLARFFGEVAAMPSLEVVLWTAAVRSVYTALMEQVHRRLAAELNATRPLWQHILFRDNCSARRNGSYFKDLSLLNRGLDRLVMVDNMPCNFEGFELNGLPIDEFWGHRHDAELAKLGPLIADALRSEDDVRCALHRAAYRHRLSTKKLDAMLRGLRPAVAEDDCFGAPLLPQHRDPAICDEHCEDALPTPSASEYALNSVPSHASMGSEEASRDSLSLSGSDGAQRLAFYLFGSAAASE